ncbi:MAG: lipoyl synthase [Legionellales bacterium]|nr:lipoyl synthase [Legionellales bacterium]HAV93667.1 lipoyl synthase [Pseudomonadota bacterium]|tara:strand:- start:1433 stop:2395 length:963 start_codon:yes stop_codon:yes gene_type:complete
MTKILDKAKSKMDRIPVKIPVRSSSDVLPKPDWAKVTLSHNPKIRELKKLLREQNLVTVCEEATCPNISECFSKGTATFMIMGDKCTRRCTFCDVAHGRPDPLDPNEPTKLADAIAKLNLKYVVITSVDRDDLRDGGAAHFRDCIQSIRQRSPEIMIEVLVPDFRKRMDIAIERISEALPDVFNHNIETTKSLYRQARPGSCYDHSLSLLSTFKKKHPHIPTKSGIMVGLGETDSDVVQTLKDLRAHQVDMVTIGQYLAPSKHHLPVARYLSPKAFDEIGQIAKDMGFNNVASGFMVRSSYHADLQAEQNHHEIAHAEYH